MVRCLPAIGNGAIVANAGRVANVIIELIHVNNALLK
jgi:hypothetical protein